MSAAAYAPAAEPTTGELHDRIVAALDGNMLDLDAALSFPRNGQTYLIELTRYDDEKQVVVAEFHEDIVGFEEFARDVINTEPEDSEALLEEAADAHLTLMARREIRRYLAAIAVEMTTSERADGVYDSEPWKYGDAA